VTRAPGRRKVLVTGASRGIGEAVAERFRAENYDVLAPPRESLDMANTEAVWATAREAYGDVDVLINNAGENNLAALEDIELPELLRAISVNLLGPFSLVRLIAPRMASRGWGRIVNISSIYSPVSRARRSMYTTAKSAVDGLTRAAAVELGPRGVLVNSIRPGFVDTELTRQNNSAEQIAALCTQVPLGRLAQPAEIANAVFFLGSEHNTFITGQTLAVDGGFLCQ